MNYKHLQGYNFILPLTPDRYLRVAPARHTDAQAVRKNVVQGTLRLSGEAPFATHVPVAAPIRMGEDGKFYIRTVEGEARNYGARKGIFRGSNWGLCSGHRGQWGGGAWICSSATDSPLCKVAIHDGRVEQEAFWAGHREGLSVHADVVSTADEGMWHVAVPCGTHDLVQLQMISGLEIDVEGSTSYYLRRTRHPLGKHNVGSPCPSAVPRHSCTRRACGRSTGSTCRSLSRPGSRPDSWDR